MRVLLDTNIIIHREAQRVIREEIGHLFQWLDKLKYTKCIHPVTVEELTRYADPNAVKSMKIKIGNYHELKTVAAFGLEIAAISKRYDKNENDLNDSKILNEVYAGRVDLLISEDKRIHTKAAELGISEKIFKIDAFLEKVTAENPGLVDYKVLAVRKMYFGEVDLADAFFNSFREDYQQFDAWFNKKADELCYVCYQSNVLSAFLFVKVEDETESYIDVSPVLAPKRRLKIGTFKVTNNGFKLGERFLKIIFDNAYTQKVSEIYVTIFERRTEQQRLISLLQEWGFVLHGIKATKNGDEQVLVKNYTRPIEVNLSNPKLSYPFISRTNDVYIVPIYPEYHTDLLPDSYLKTESPMDFIESEPHRNALSKVYVCRSKVRNLRFGDRIVFYRTKSQSAPAYYTGVATTVGVVESVITEIKDEASFIALCRKRSVFTDDELRQQWNYNKHDRPFITNFLFVYSLPKRPNLEWLNKNGVIPDTRDMPRGFRKIRNEDFTNIVKYSFSK